MTLHDIFKSKDHSAYIASLLEVTGSIKFPCNSENWETVLEQLVQLSAETNDALCIFIQCPHGVLFDRRHLSDMELYMLRQRVLCGIDALGRLVEALPSDDWLQTQSDDLTTIDSFLYSGLWRSFGHGWMRNLAVRFARGDAS